MDSKFSHSQWSLRVSLDGGGGTGNRAILRRVREFCSVLGRGYLDRCCELRFLARFLWGGSGGRALLFKVWRSVIWTMIMGNFLRTDILWGIVPMERDQRERDIP
jgi:hypothetical protein